jgi:hypothetical protein
MTLSANQSKRGMPREDSKNPTKRAGRPDGQRGQSKRGMPREDSKNPTSRAGRASGFGQVQSKRGMQGAPSGGSASRIDDNISSL